MYTLRSQLLIPTEWEHINQGFIVSSTAKSRMKKYGVGLVDDGQSKEALEKYLGQEACGKLINYKNTATQIIDRQGKDLAKLRSLGVIEDFRHMEMQKVLSEFYVHQGKCERIKKFPLPRQYGSMSLVFVSIFIFLLPFGMVSEFMKLGSFGAFLSIPFTAIVGWVFMVMELVGDYSENPFEGMPNDIPMLALCRTIEIDLLEMIGEKDLPSGIETRNGVLM